MVQSSTTFFSSPKDTSACGGRIMHMSSAFGRRYAGEYKGMEWLL